MDDRHVYAQLLLKFFIPIMKNDTFFFRPETNDWPFRVLGKAGRKMLLLMLLGGGGVPVNVTAAVRPRARPTSDVRALPQAAAGHLISSGVVTRAQHPYPARRADSHRTSSRRHVRSRAERTPRRRGLCASTLPPRARGARAPAHRHQAITQPGKRKERKAGAAPAGLVE